MQKKTIVLISMVILVVGIAINEIYATTTKVEPEIKLAIKSYEHIYVQYPYGFAVKVFDGSLVKNADYDSYYGTLPGVNVTVNLVSDSGNVLHTFQGVTDSHGYYSDSYRIRNDPGAVNFHAIFNATKSGYKSASDVKQVYIQHLPTSGSFNSSGTCHIVGGSLVC